MKYFRYYLIAIIVIIIDQVTKLLVHNNMELGYGGQISVIGDWFKLYYVLNPGIAFGINFESEYSKFFLTVFRLIASFGIGYYLLVKIKEQAHTGLLICISLILAGAVGNVVDSVFYGVFLEGNVIDNAFTPWFHGQVIDMLYFPLIEGTIPSWLPIWGGEHFLFFSAIFNVADSSIFIGVVTILIFQKKFLPKEDELQEGEYSFDGFNPQSSSEEEGQPSSTSNDIASKTVSSKEQGDLKNNPE
ncbi:lipoprotein signal peptidase [Flexithrix dorotheae]|uniref:lipoprotein signal peptidase n=1 Tax=Flexithrix dorotheae TaxID=70993 RepID=UPI0005C5AE40|nr:lipoprotein signal peptidase [Flexithrix dorotheae]